MFSEIGTPNPLGVRRDERERERECWNGSVNIQILDDLSVDAIDDPMMRICCQ